MVTAWKTIKNKWLIKIVEDSKVYLWLRNGAVLCCICRMYYVHCSFWRGACLYVSSHNMWSMPRTEKLKIPSISYKKWTIKTAKFIVVLSNLLRLKNIVHRGAFLYWIEWTLVEKHALRGLNFRRGSIPCWHQMTRWSYSHLSLFF